MSKKRSSELEQQAAEQADDSPRGGFDFTGPVEDLDDESKRVYYRLRRAAIIAKDESRLPDGKNYTQAQVVDILGEDYAHPGSSPKCCG